MIVLISFWEANTPHLLVLYQMGFMAPARGKPHKGLISNPHSLKSCKIIINLDVLHFEVTYISYSSEL